MENLGQLSIRLTNTKIDIMITTEEFQYFWKRVRERTASSIFGIRYGHYKACAHSDRVASFLAKKITLAARIGRPPEC